MKIYKFLVSCALVVELCVGISTLAHAERGIQGQQKHAYTEYEKLVLKNVSEFHKNFSNHEFYKNSALVTDNIIFNTSGTEYNGRDAFVNAITDFAAPFPDAKITDLVTIVDGNTAAIRYVLTGTHKGEFKTPNGVVAATGRKVKVDGIEIFTFDKDGKVTEIVGIDNVNQLLKQIQSK
ncbi:ester cyclase [Serratia marcescens]|nr:ester cyclase [Serratia marcescens]